ncbi:nucleotidyltransferase domain-containing protein [Patescibacteria group bacterium]|nr:nucleotidyltransferase domain-containing protein [Patescibacteria group bacterium]
MISLRSEITQKVLRYFFTNRHNGPYVRDLARTLQIDPSNLSKKLRELEREGILQSRQNGVKEYRLNTSYPLLKDIERLFSATYGLPEMLRQALRKIPGISRAFIFGSYAKGSFGLESDVDICIIGGHSALEVKREILPLQKNLGRDFNILDISENELSRKLKLKDRFLENIMSGKKIELIP